MKIIRHLYKVLCAYFHVKLIVRYIESACNSENRFVAEFSDLSVITPIHPLPSPGSKHVLHAFTEHKLPNITAYIY